MIPNKKPYIIVETAFHHEGDIVFLTDLLDRIFEIDVQAIKFHLLFDLEDYIIENHPAKAVLENIMLSKDDILVMLEKCKQNNIDIILLANDLESLKWINSIKDDFPIVGVELHSTGLNDIFLLQECIGFDKTIILGVGGSTFDEISFAIDFLKENGKTDLLLMHGFQNYPTNFSDINLRRMDFYNDAFGLPVGYADHTDPLDPLNTLISILPQGMGHNILEKHVTHKFGEKRIDSQAAISIENLKEIIFASKAAFQSVGCNNLVFSEAEKNYGNTGPMKKALVAREDLPKGTQITLDNLAFKRTEESSPLSQKDIYKLLNGHTTNDIKKDEILSFSNISYSFNKADFSQFFISKTNDK